ncbi:SDR family oxidoreductase [Phenylobacterium sp. LjRoot219]|uniref:SDR family oxidoreductase n=1 Tax=Phenylobacterium sp. LjRoot219 TaxID=3342283 RepID=UPI003ECE128C
MGWTVSDLPSQRGRTAVVTGAGGLGYETALGLAQAGAEVVVAGRNPTKGEAAVAQIRSQVPQARVAFEPVDLADLASIAAFAERFKSSRRKLDLLVNNAGVMAPPSRQTTADGFELQFGTNYLGHFALTARLLPQLLNGERPRVVNVSSLAHRNGKLDFGDLQTERPYKPFRAYSLSKLAQVVFTLELQRRSEANGWGLTSAAAHPGFATTELIANGQGANSLMARAMGVINPWLSQSPAAGALPTLYAAAATDATGGALYGPDGLMEMKGAPKRAWIAPVAIQADAARLWSVSEQLAGVQLAP